MTSDFSQQVDTALTPGTLLRSARLAQGLTEFEVSERLNLMPDYVGILERGEYQQLRSPAFARGYIKAYGQLLGLDVDDLLALFDELRSAETQIQKRVETKPLQAQSTGAGVIIGLLLVLLLFAGLWYWHKPVAPADLKQEPLATEQQPVAIEQQPSDTTREVNREN